MLKLDSIQIAIRGFEYPESREAFEIWKNQTLAMLESSTNRSEAEPLPHLRLSPREHQVMSMLLEGRRLKEIAARLDISVKTVTTHRTRLLRKLRVEDNLGLYRYGIRSGLITA